MADIRKRTGRKGTTYQVRYADPSKASGYAYATFYTLKEARAFRENAALRQGHMLHTQPGLTVERGVQTWLDICEKEGRNGRDPVTKYTLKHYEWRADIINSYDWPKPLSDMSTPDIIEFRSWLLRNYSRNVARKVLSSLHSVTLELVTRGMLQHDIVSGVTIRSTSRYDEPVKIPSEAEVRTLLAAADALATSSNLQTRRVWRRYRPMLYLAADSGMRPQEYVAVARSNLFDGGVNIDRALERGERRISVTKTPAGRRFIELSPKVYEMVQEYAERHAVENEYDLVFPTSTGNWQTTDNWRKRGFYAACLEAELVDNVKIGSKVVQKPRYRPYDLRHFFASMLIEQRANLKRIQKLMGHEDITTTMNVYGHLIERAEEKARRPGLVESLTKSCGDTVATEL